MYQKLIESLLTHMGEKTGQSPPTRYEVIIIHCFYLAPLLWAGALAWDAFYAQTSLTDKPRAIGFGTILEVTGGLAALTVLFLIWAAKYRKKPIDMWAASHLVWISQSYLNLALFSALAVVAFGVLLLLGAISTTIAAIAIYGLPILALLTVGLFLIRL